MTGLALANFSFFEFIFAHESISICVNAIQIYILIFLFLKLTVYSIVGDAFIWVADKLNIHLGIMVSHFEVGMSIELVNVYFIFLVDCVLRVATSSIFVLFFIIIKIIFNMMKFRQLIFTSKFK